VLARLCVDSLISMHRAMERPHGQDTSFEQNHRDSAKYLFLLLGVFSFPRLILLELDSAGLDQRHRCFRNRETYGKSRLGIQPPHWSNILLKAGNSLKCVSSL